MKEKRQNCGIQKRKIWAFAHTPFQVICIAELCGYLARLNYESGVLPYLLILGTPRANTTNASARLANFFSLDHKITRISKLIPNSVASIIYLLICRRTLRKAKPGDILVVGTGMHYRYVDLLARSRHLERWVVDDGTASIYLFQTYEKYGNPLRAVNWDSYFYRIIVRYVFRVKEPVWTSIHWYTIFYPEFRNIPNIHYNKLQRTKMVGRREGVADEIWFMGAPLIHGGIVSGAVFARWSGIITEKLKNWYPEMKLRYILHPDERKQLSAYREIYEKFDECVYFGEPIESVIASAEWVPGIVVSILSTSVLTMRELLPAESRVLIFLPDIQEISTRRMTHVKPIIEFLSSACKNRGISVTEIASMSISA